MKDPWWQECNIEEIEDVDVHSKPFLMFIYLVGGWTMRTTIDSVRQQVLRTILFIDHCLLVPWNTFCSYLAALTNF